MNRVQNIEYLYSLNYSSIILPPRFPTNAFESFLLIRRFTFDINDFDVGTCTQFKRQCCHLEGPIKNDETRVPEKMTAIKKGLIINLLFEPPIIEHDD